MEIESALYIIYSNTSITVSIVLAFMFWNRRRAAGAKSMTLIMILASWWGLLELFSDMARIPYLKIFWDNLSFVGVAFLPVAWFIFVLEYTKSERYLIPRNIALLCIMPVITNVMIWTNDYHHLVTTERSFTTVGYLSVIDYSYRSWFWIHAVYSYSLMALGVILLIIRIFKMPQILRSQAKLITVAILIPYVGNILSVTGINTIMPFDPTTFLFTVTGLVCFLGLFRYKLFELVPVARDAVIEDMSEALIVMDNHNNIIDANDSAIRLLNLDKGDYIGRHINDVLGRRAPDFAKYENLTQVKDKLSIEMYEMKRYFDLKITPLLDNKSKLMGKFITLYDITAMEEAIVDLEESRKAAVEANSMKSRFLASMSHEIRTPLNGIIGMSELLDQTNRNQEEAEYIRLIRSCAFSLLGIINDILDISKIEAGKMQLERTYVNLDSLLGDTISTFLPQRKGKDIELVYTIDESIPRNLVSDPVRLRQIFVNLIGNAFKFTEKGRIEVRAELISSTSDQALVGFMVTDTGIGIPEDKMDSLFKSFEQVDSSTTRKYGGTGLGLAIVKNIVSLMGGSIEVESKPGAGSRFRLVIPFVTAEIAAPEAAATADIGFDPGEINILLAEDNKANQVLMVKLLEKKKLKADVAENGEVVLNMLKEKHYDLILMDIQMPVMDGYEAAMAIRKEEEGTGRHVPIIALTANATPEDKNMSLQTGMDDFLTKPVVPSRLYECLNKHIS